MVPLVAVICEWVSDLRIHSRSALDSRHSRKSNSRIPFSEVIILIYNNPTVWQYFTISNPNRLSCMLCSLIQSKYFACKWQTPLNISRCFPAIHNMYRIYILQNADVSHRQLKLNKLNFSVSFLWLLNISIYIIFALGPSL